MPQLRPNRYSEFDNLRTKLLLTFPNSYGAMPPLPPKSLIRVLLLIPTSSSASADRSKRKISPQFPGEAENWVGILFEVRALHVEQSCD